MTTRNLTLPDNPCEGFNLSPTLTNGQFTSRFVKETGFEAIEATFDLSQSRQWVLPDVKGSAFDSDVFTLNSDGSFDTLTGFYDYYQRSWTLSEDNKTLTLKITHPDYADEFNQMTLQLVRALDSAYTVLAKFSSDITNEDPIQRFSKLDTVLQVKGDGVVSQLNAVAGTNKLILSSVNSRNKEWQQRQRLPGDWFGWKLNADNTSFTPSFTCDGESVFNLAGEVCTGSFAMTAQPTNLGVWQVKNNQLQLERGTAGAYTNGDCIEGEPCNLRVIVPLFVSQGVITGYEYNVFSDAIAEQRGMHPDRNNFQIMPRVMHWTLQELPAVE